MKGGQVRAADGSPRGKAARKRLRTALARAEALRERNDRQREALLAGAAAMADHATGVLQATGRRVLAGDAAAGEDARRAALGRYLARQLVGRGRP